MLEWNDMHHLRNASHSKILSLILMFILGVVGCRTAPRDDAPVGIDDKEILGPAFVLFYTDN